MFERVRALLDEDPLDNRETDAAHEAAMAKGWDDPALNVYIRKPTLSLTLWVTLVFGLAPIYLTGGIGLAVEIHRLTGRIASCEIPVCPITVDE